jgi:hypothetical protein
MRSAITAFESPTFLSGVNPNVYIASHVISGIYVAAVAKYNQVKFKCVTRSLKFICFVCIYVFTNSD